MNKELLEKVNLIRNATGVGMSDAIKYLKEFKDPEIAISELLKKGFKKLDENIQERVLDIAMSEDFKKCSLLILGCRTDFVSATSIFKENHKKLSIDFLNNNIDESILDLLSQKTGERVTVEIPIENRPTKIGKLIIPTTIMAFSIDEVNQQFRNVVNEDYTNIGDDIYVLKNIFSFYI